MHGIRGSVVGKAAKIALVGILKNPSGPPTTPLASALSTGLAPTGSVTAEQVQSAQAVLAATQAAPSTTLVAPPELQAAGPPAAPPVLRKVIPLAEAVKRAASAPGAEPPTLPVPPPKESQMVRLVIPDAPVRGAPATVAAPVSTVASTAPAATPSVAKAAPPPPTYK